MKRLLIVAALAISTIVGTHGLTKAQGVPPPPTVSPTPTPSPTPVPAIDPAHFALSVWDFPGPAHILDSRVESNSQTSAERDLQHFGPSFAAESRLTGYYMASETANLDAGGNLHPLVIFYLVSTFASPELAATAFTQQKNGWEGLIAVPPAATTAMFAASSAGQPGDLSAGGIYVETGKSTTGQTIDLSELLFKRGIYLIEIFAENLHADAAKYGVPARNTMLQIGRRLDTVASGVAVGPLKPSLPRTANISILSTRFEANGLRYDPQSNLKLRPLTRISVGKALQASTYVVVKAAPPGSKYTVEFRVARGKHALVRKFTHTLGTYPPNYYRDRLYNVTLRTAGTYSLQIRITMGHTSKFGTARIIVGKGGIARTLRPRGATEVGATSGETSRHLSHLVLSGIY